MIRATNRKQGLMHMLTSGAMLLMLLFSSCQNKKSIVAGIELKDKVVDLQRISYADPKVELYDATELSYQQLINWSKQRYAKEHVVYKIWGTWCDPCKIDFKKCEEMKDNLVPAGVRFVYVCTDYKSNKEKWKKTVAKYNPKGVHVFLGEEEVKGLMRVFEVQGYPSYFMVRNDLKVHTDVFDGLISNHFYTDKNLTAFRSLLEE